MNAAQSGTNPGAVRRTLWARGGDGIGAEMYRRFCHRATGVFCENYSFLMILFLTKFRFTCSLSGQIEVEISNWPDGEQIVRNIFWNEIIYGFSLLLFWHILVLKMFISWICESLTLLVFVRLLAFCEIKISGISKIRKWMFYLWFWFNI